MTLLVNASQPLILVGTSLTGAHGQCGIEQQYPLVSPFFQIPM
jgi:hypothetical protein